MNKKVKQNKTIQNYFASVDAIPEDIRKSFLKKILKRKGASNQKNVKLIKLIYSFIENDRTKEWNEVKICTQLDISMNMLYWHKSAFLKELRKFYFGWRKIERNEFSTIPAIDNKKSYESVKFSYEKAKRMFEIGMRQEAKSVFLVLARNLEKNLTHPPKKLSWEKIILLSNIFDYLIRYYFSCRSSFKFNLYFAKLKKIVEDNSAKLDAEKVISLQMIYLTAKGLKATFRASEVSNYTEGLEYLFEANKKAKLLSNDEYLFYTTLLIDDISLRLKHRNRAKVKKCIKDAGKAVIRNKNASQILAFKALEACFELETSKPKPNDYYLKTVEECYEAAKLLPRNSYYTIIQGMLIRVLGLLGYEEEFIDLTKEVYYSNVLESSKFSAWWKSYIYQNMKLDQTRYSWKLSKNTNCKIFIPVLDEINFHDLGNLNTLITQALTYYKNIFSFFVYYAIYQGIILAEFFTADKGDYKRTLMFIKKLKSIQKDKSVNTENYVELIKAGIAIVNEMSFHTEEYISDKYKNIIVDSINNFIENDNGVNLMDRYALLVHIAQLTNLKFIWRLTEDFYRKLREKNPDEIKILLSGIKSKYYSKAS